MPQSALVRKLSIVADLTADEQSRVDALCLHVRRVRRRQDISSEGQRPEHVNLILTGWAARYKILPDGSRQIIDFLIPGDFCDLHVTILGELDHGIIALTPCDLAQIDPHAIDRLISESSSIACAFWWATLVSESILREWIVNLGGRDAFERVAHLLCEMHYRMRLIGLVKDNQLALPLTQAELADATGLTAVHVNRTVQRLRREKLIELGEGALTLLDADALCALAGFKPNYLHINRRGNACMSASRQAAGEV